MEQVVEISEFVVKIPSTCLKSESESGDLYLYNAPAFYYSDHKHGIKGKIKFSQTESDLHVDCHASFVGTNQADCTNFNFHVKVYLWKDIGPRVKLASESAPLSANQDRNERVIEMKISRYTILKMEKYDKLRVVVNIEAVAVKDPKPAFLKRFQSGEDSDVQLICEDEIFPVHTFILKTVSHVFRTMLEVPMKEAATGQIVIKDLSLDTVKNMVHYIYHGRLNTGSDAQVIECLYAAEKYELDSFKTACLERMVTSMSDENITSFLEMSVRVNAGNEFIKQMVDYSMAHIKELRKREDFPAFFRANPSVFL